jgi:hypothetical protein
MSRSLKAELKCECIWLIDPMKFQQFRHFYLSLEDSNLLVLLHGKYTQGKLGQIYLFKHTCFVISNKQLISNKTFTFASSQSSLKNLVC